MERLIGRDYKLSRGAGSNVRPFGHYRMLSGFLIRLPKQEVNSSQCRSSANGAGVSVVIIGLP